MKPRSKREGYWRAAGKEARKYYQQGVGAFRTARQFTRKQCNKAMRTQGKRESHGDD